MHGHEVAAAVGIPVVVPIRWGYGGLAKLPVLCRVGLPAFVEITSRGVDAVVETLPLHVAELTRGLIPSALTGTRAIRLRHQRLKTSGNRWQRGTQQCEGNGRCYESKFHNWRSPRS